MVNFKKYPEYPVVDQHDIAKFVQYDTGYDMDIILNVIYNLMLIIGENTVLRKKTIVHKLFSFMPRMTPNLKVNIVYNNGEKNVLTKVKRKSYHVHYTSLQKRPHKDSSEV